MKSVTTMSAVILLVSFLGGCAPVKFYSNSGLTQSSGLKYYTVKPYLLVEKEASTNNVVKATVIYMPDLENPQYMVLRDGFGSRKVDVKLTDGTINTFGVSTEADLAKTIEAFSSVIDKSAEAVKDISLKGVPGAAPATYVELYDISLNDGVTSLRKIEFR
jgi:hypothetical protein